MTPFLFEPGEDMRPENIRVEDVSAEAVDLFGQQPIVCPFMADRSNRLCA
jgi:hypothetical protein